MADSPVADHPADWASREVRTLARVLALRRHKLSGFQIARVVRRSKACVSRLLLRHRHRLAALDMHEVAKLSRVTPSLRPNEYLNRILRPATNNIGRALAYENLPETVKKKLEKSRRKQDGWRATLGGIALAEPVVVHVPPETPRWVEIREAGGRLITVIEVLSRSNKIGDGGNE